LGTSTARKIAKEERAMAGDPMSPEVLASVPSELEAAAIVDALAAAGIRARAVGGYTAGFRAEAPGDVRVVVGRANLARAEEVLAEFRSQPAQVDWSQVDVGDGLTGDDEAGHDEAGEDASSEDGLPWYQFKLATLLAVQTIASFGLAAWKSLSGWVDFALVFFLTYLALMAVMPLLIAVGTIGIATDLNRARQIWRYLGRALCAGIGLAVLLFVFARVAVALGVRF